MAQRRMVRVDVHSDLWLPEHIMRMKAKERAAYLMKRYAAYPDSTPLDDLGIGGKVQGVHVTQLDSGEKDFLIVPSFGACDKAEVEYLVGMCKAGYGNPIDHTRLEETRKNWPTIVGNAIDHRVELRKKKQTGRSLCLTRP